MDTVFVDGVTLTQAEWFQDVNDPVYDQIANAKNSEYDAVGDGANDDTVPIQSAIDAMYALGGGVVVLPPGTYKITSALNLKNGVRMVGAGLMVTIIKGTFAGNLVNFLTVSSGEILNDVWLEHVTLDGVSTSNGGVGAAIVPSETGGASSRQCGMRYVLAQNLAKGASFFCTQQFDVVDCAFRANTAGVYVTTQEAVTGVNHLVRFSDCDFRSNGKGVTGTYISGAKPYQWHFDNCHFELNTTHGLDLNGVGAQRWQFDNCKWEQNGTNAIDLTGAELFVFNTGYFNNNSNTTNTEQIRSVQAGPNDGGGHVFNDCEWGGAASANDIRFDFVPRNVLTNCHISADKVSNTRSDIRYDNCYRSIPVSPAGVVRRRVAAWIRHTQTGANYISICPTNNTSYAGNAIYWVDQVKIHVTDAFAGTGGTQTAIQVGDEAGAQGIAQSQDVETTGVKTPTLNSTGYTARGAVYFVVTLFTDRVLSAGKALVILDYSEVPLKP